jgi:HSP20 family protein
MEDADRLFFGGFGHEWPHSASFEPEIGEMAVWAPRVDVVEKNGRLEVHADLPGLKPEEVKVSIEGDMLTISGERKHEHEEKDKGVYRCERSYGTFERRIALPQGVDPGSIEARFENGVLEVSMPAPDRTRARSIAVKTGPKPPSGGLKS